MQERAVLLKHVGKREQLNGRRVVFERDVGHHRLVARGLHLDVLHDTGHGHDLFVMVLLSVVGEAVHNGKDWRDVCSAQLFAVVVHGMPRQIQPRRLLLHAHALCRAQLRQLGHMHGRDARFLGLLPHVKQTHLPVDIVAPAVCHRVHDRFIDLQHLRALEAKAVTSAALDEVFHCALVEVGAVQAPAEVLEPGKPARLLPLGHDLLDKAAANVLDRRQTEADAGGRDGKMVVRFVDIRRQHGNVHRLALGDILGDLARRIEHRGHERRHILAWIVVLEPRRLVRDDSVADGMRLVEGIVGEVIHLVVDAFGHADGDAVGLAAADIARGVAVNERAALFFNVFDLLLGHGPAHHVCLPEGIPAQLAEDLNDLLLIQDAAVGNRQNGL